MEPDDAALMRAYAAGDARAFERLYARHSGALYRFVRRLLGREAGTQCDEVFQDIWLRVVRARERWSPQGATFRTWLFTLAHHRAIDVLRRSGREVSTGAADDDEAEREPWQPAPASEAWRDWPAAPSSNVEDSSFWRAAGQRLLDCLDGLPAVQRSAFLLHHEDGLAVDELARTLDVGFETAKSRLRYAMSKLRACMGAYLPAGMSST
ncbi:MAG TPA: sigma-70 family RNA polymerase sigma factor [Burkholderiaceae bacterium]|nr:sigma-70 family RNA polymerase sigma factor [Burkholderiaceae bacterium]